MFIPEQSRNIECVVYILCCVEIVSPLSRVNPLGSGCLLQISDCGFRDVENIYFLLGGLQPSEEDE